MNGTISPLRRLPLWRTQGLLLQFSNIIRILLHSSLVKIPHNPDIT